MMRTGEADQRLLMCRSFRARELSFVRALVDIKLSHVHANPAFCEHMLLHSTSIMRGLQSDSG
jgi:hypothetical protein